MSEPGSTIPFDRLPPGFAESLDDPPADPVPARPAATIVLLRDGEAGLEVLLLRRVRSAGFVPGAWVFPGGRVDADDEAGDLVARLDGLDAEEAARRLELEGDTAPGALAYVIAALREAFEETGLLVARHADGSPAPSAAEDERVARARDRVLADEDAFATVLGELDLRLDGSAVAYIAHWITPVVEPRRYDTRFFAAAVAGSGAVALHEAELSEAVWLAPNEALRRNREGTLPMVFPTLKTIETLAEFSDTDGALATLEARPVPTILPRLVRTPTGVGLEIDDD